MDFKKLNKRIEIKYETQIKWMVVLVMLRYAMTYLYDITARIPDLLRTNIVSSIIKVLIIIPPVLVYRKYSINKQEYNFKNWKQYIYAIALIVPLYICKVVFFGPGHMYIDSILEINILGALWELFYYLILTGLFEEFFYRQYVQGELEVILGKVKFIAPLIAAILFGYAHTIQGGINSAYFTFWFGIILGYSRFFFENCTMLSVIIAHGLYDYIVVMTGL